jgi:hypothetical protein
MAGPRQVKARNALQHNVGLGGACVVTIYSLGFPAQLKPYPKASVMITLSFQPESFHQGKRNPALELDPSEPTHATDSIELHKAPAKL